MLKRLLSKVVTLGLNPPLIAVKKIVQASLEEDLLPMGDLTASLIDPNVETTASFVSRQEGILAGTLCMMETIVQIDPTLDLNLIIVDGQKLEKGSCIAHLQGRLSSILIAERTALNFLCHLSGIASLTHLFVQQAFQVNPNVGIRDTRKTLPGLRALEKAAIRAGGGYNHRGNLSDSVLLKDNHLGGITIPQAFSMAKKMWPGRTIEVECDSLDQVRQAVEIGVDFILLDNMNVEQVKNAVEIVRNFTDSNKVKLEVSGGISFDSIQDYAATGVDYLAIGSLTHSAPSLDIGLDLQSQIN